MSAFATAGARLRENGISVLPIAPNAKAPGTMTAGQWRLEHGWSRFCDRLPTPLEMGIWEKWPDGGVGVALGPASAPPGQQLVAVDIDTDDPTIQAAIFAVIPPSPVRKKGRTGQTCFYLASTGLAKAKFDDAEGKRLLDLLTHGRQSVLPPTIHPQSGQPYFWLTRDTLEDYDVADLPELPDDIVARLDAALAPFGHVPAELRVGPAGDATLAGESIHRALNDAALANLDAWVPALSLFGCTRSAGGYRAVASWRASATGRPLAKRALNLSIKPNGIYDFNGGEKGYTPLDLVMAACGADLDTAFRWLQDHVAPQKAVVLSVTPPPRNNLAGLIDAGAELPTPDNVVEMPALEPVEVDGVVPEAACFPPGLLGEIVEWIVASSETPSPQLALGAAIVLLGGLTGRRFEGPTRARTNFYGIGVAPTGWGKDWPCKAGPTLAYAAGLQKYVGPDDIKSDSAIRKLLEARPTVAVFIDEFGGYLRKILDRRAASHDARTRDLLLTMFSRANGIYGGSEGATEKAVPIINPNLGVFGVSTPTDLWKAFTSASAEDGLLPRFLIFGVPEGRPEIVEPTMEPDTPPHALLQRLRALMDIRPKGNLNGVAGQANKPIRATWADGADAWFHAFRTFKREEAIASGGMREIVASREAEHLIKLANLYAVGCDAQNPVISLAALEWAREVVTASSAALLAALESRVADSDRQAEYLWVLRTVREAGSFGIPEAVLIRMIRGRFDKRRYDDIVAQLMSAGEVSRAVGSGPKGGRPAARLFPMAEQAEEAA